MMTDRPRFFFARLGALAILAGEGLIFPISAADPPAPGTPSNLHADCKAQLSTVYESLFGFQRLNGGTYPTWLKDLHPQFAHHSDELVCPLVRLSGKAGLGTTGIRTTNREDPLTGYRYEASPAKEAGRTATLDREESELRYKQQQVKLLGGVVPIVRCLAHREAGLTCLNLSFAGEVYESGLYWENHYRHISDSRLLATSDGFLEVPVTPPDYPERSPDLDPAAIDLEPYYNASITAAWGLGKEVRTLEPEPGMVFDLRGLIQLAGTGFRYDDRYPREVRIPIGAACPRLHLLLSTTYRVPPGTVVANLQIHLDEETLILPIRHGHEVQGWQEGPGPPSLPDPGTPADKPVLSGRVVSESHMGLQATIMTWTNRPGNSFVRSLSLVSTEGETAPMLLAVRIGGVE